MSLDQNLLVLEREYAQLTEAYPLFYQFQSTLNIFYLFLFLPFLSLYLANIVCELVEWSILFGMNEITDSCFFVRDNTFPARAIPRVNVYCPLKMHRLALVDASLLLIDFQVCFVINWFVAVTISLRIPLQIYLRSLLEDLKNPPCHQNVSTRTKKMKK